MATVTVDTSTFGRSMKPQLSSPFFTLLPAEIRNLIYREFWRLCSTRQHIVQQHTVLGQQSDGWVRQWSHVACITDPRAQDTRFDRFLACDSASAERTLWGIRLKSEWCLHWQCEDQSMNMSFMAIILGSRPIAEELVKQETASRPSMTTGHFNLLTVCKRM
ncbi:hypothetical protein N657DRAFT_310774 [Parathielavia appendiculata]|uniref:Uncharacterized protein n=1 Tax=Parathielavia appendiculata TaxID=2587402 RepID=A0AAN6Z618_9PEZI|nr:hypothetical protein N657DRAFT_310774 [Parathielavia appendiculata]